MNYKSAQKGNDKRYDQKKPEERISKENAGGLSEAAKEFLRDSLELGHTVEDRILIALRDKK